MFLGSVDLLTRKRAILLKAERVGHQTFWGSRFGHAKRASSAKGRPQISNQTCTEKKQPRKSVKADKSWSLGSLEQEQPPKGSPMIILSTNNCGLGGKAKTLTLLNLCDNSNPEIILIHKTMGPFNSLLPELSHIFPSLHFIGTDFIGLSGGLISDFSPKITIQNSFAIEVSLFVKIHTLKLNRHLKILNVYRPYVGKASGIAHSVYNSCKTTTLSSETTSTWQSTKKKFEVIKVEKISSHTSSLTNLKHATLLMLNRCP